MRLFRGDSISRLVAASQHAKRGRTFAEHYLGNGLMAKYSDGGSSSLLDGKDLLDMVLAHVGYEADSSEQSFSYRSPFLSFSADPASAMYFAERTGKREIEECTFSDATFCVWQLEIELNEEIAPGRFLFRYYAHSGNCREIVNGAVRRAIAFEAATGDSHELAQQIGNLFALSNVDNDRLLHTAELIDVYRYVISQDAAKKSASLLKNTLERARRWKEWLLFVTDPMPDGMGTSSRFVMNRHLSLYRCYRYRN